MMYSFDNEDGGKLRNLTCVGSVHIFSSPTSFIKELVISGRFQTGAPYQIQFMELFDSLTLVFKKCN